VVFPVSAGALSKIDFTFPLRGRKIIAMKVIAQTAALQEALALTGGIVNARSPKPVLQCVKLVAKDDTLWVMATDLEEIGRASCRERV